MSALQDDPEASQAALVLNQVWLDQALARARANLTARASWPETFGNSLGGNLSRVYLTPAEAEELSTELQEVFDRLVGLGSRYGSRRTAEVPRRRTLGEPERA